MALSYIKIFLDFEERTEALSDNERGRLLLAMLRYAAGKETALSGNERIIWPVFKMEIDQYMAAYNTKVENGCKGGRPCKDETEQNRTKPEETENNLKKPDETEINRNSQEQDKDKEEDKEKEKENKKEKEKRDREESERLFNDFWTLYPRKDAKKDAVKAWNRIRPGPEMADVIMSALRKQIYCDLWTRDGGHFIPYASTWLNGERWKDEGTSISSGKSGGNLAADYNQRDYSGEQEEATRRMLAMMEDAETERWSP